SSATAAASSATAADSSAYKAQSIANEIKRVVKSTGDNGEAIDSEVSGNNATAVGSGSKVKGNNSSAFGSRSKVSANNGTAIGTNSSVKAEGGTAIGANATVKESATNSVAIGNGSVATEANTVSVGRVGNERRITNVADPVNNTDAANKRYVDSSVRNIRNDLRQTDKKLRAGLAGVNAAAALPQVYTPGRAMLSVAGGAYKGETGVAVGYSRASDSGKVILKIQGNANSSGEYGAGVGVGYQW
ncbi:YadA family autotransporter adhesin, partial [Mannheimia indoligenes]|uniref:YadA family autotransporter adhesin n=1 Tax=Mannheimia indoligenes TaxID=3103145 RepID=UPI002FE59AEB